MTGFSLRDARLPHLKKLAWVWSALNLLLAVAVFNRLIIYVDFNGLTRLRMVAFLGISTVMVGFLMTVLKIIHERNFAWLIRADLWALLGTVMLYALLPIDLMVMRYNVSRILTGHLAPAVQIAVQPMDVEGLRELLPLMRAPDITIREGVKALLAPHGADIAPASHAGLFTVQNWKELTALQISERLLQRELAATREEWAPFVEPSQQSTAWQRFVDYTYQWY